MDILDSAFRPTTPLPPTPAPTSPKVAESTSPRASTSTIRPEVVPNDEPVKEDEKRKQSLTAGIEEEVGQVVQSLSSWGGSFWGGVVKQTSSALSTIQKETTRTVQQAQSELQKLSTTSVSVDFKDPLDLAGLAAGPGAPPTAAPAAAEPVAEGETGEGVEKGKAKAVDGPPPTAQAPTAKAAQDFLNRLSSTLSTTHLPPSLSLSSLQKSLADTIAANPSLDLNHLRASVAQNIQTNLASGQVSLKQAEKLAEGYLKRSEELIAEARKGGEGFLVEAGKKGEAFLGDAGEFLKDAVKVVPPTEGDGIVASWDGSGDIYHFSTSSQPTTPTVLFDRSAPTTRPSGETARSALRKSALLRRLRSDKELLLVDPSADTESPARREAFRNFVEVEIEGKGGWEGTEVEAVVWGEMGPEAEGTEGLKAMRDALVPSQLTKEVFWTRYLFHKHSIELEEEKRKKLLEVTQQPTTEDDFSWDADEEESTPRLPAAPTPPPAASPAPTPTPAAAAPVLAQPIATTGLGIASTSTSPERERKPSVAARAVGDSAGTSPRESEESYDIVSDQGGSSVAGLTPAKEVAKKEAVEAKKVEKKDESEDEDSDWE